MECNSEADFVQMMYDAATELPEEAQFAAFMVMMTSRNFGELVELTNLNVAKEMWARVPVVYELHMAELRAKAH